MSDEHNQHDPAPEPSATPMAQEDAGSQALTEALRSSFAIVKFVMVALVVVFLGSGFFQVGTQEKAVILRFGKTVGQEQEALLGPGLHWSFPYPIDEVVKIPITEIQKISSTVGWFAETPEQELSGNLPPPGPSLIPGVDGYVITADRNIIHTRATLYYQVDDPIRYVFGFTSASNTIQNALNNALLDTAAQFKVDDVLYSDVAGFQEAVQQRVGAQADLLGITVKQCNVESTPPRQLKERNKFACHQGSEPRHGLSINELVVHRRARGVRLRRLQDRRRRRRLLHADGRNHRDPHRRGRAPIH
jgi:modulator of FtsH protease HflK